MTLAELLCMAVFSIGLPNTDLACYHMHTLVEVSEQNKIDPVIFVALIVVESRWSPKAVSRSGACGLTQVMPKWSGGKKGSFGKHLTCRQLFDPEVSIERGAKIFAYWYHNYSKARYKTALCGYNAGYRCKGENPNLHGVEYAKKVLKYANKIRRKLRILRKQEEEDTPGCMMYE